jgi:oligopeptide/dipeptide ABC transporter ATP-binding protein
MSERVPVPGPSESAPVLEVTDLRVDFPTEQGRLTAVRGLSYSVRAGEVLALVGESGSGKSVSALAVLGLLPGATRVSGSVRHRGRELLDQPDRELSKVRGSGIAMVFQDPLSALTPVYRVGDAIAAALRVHRDLSRAAARRRAVELLDLVGIPDPARRAEAFPHELSGGMRQRVLIAMAIANDPDVILADEPTTALDVTVQAQILEVFRTARRETGAAIVLVTHDLGVVAGFADRIAVMYAGRLVETGPVDEVYAAPRMPYTAGLLGSVPRPDVRVRRLAAIPDTPPSLVDIPAGCPFAPRCPHRIPDCQQHEPELLEVGSPERAAACLRTAELGPLGTGLEPGAPAGSAPSTQGAVLLEVRDLVRQYPLRSTGLVRRRIGAVRAVDGVSFELAEGQSLALVGESGCGKSTTVMAVLDLAAPQAGRVTVLGSDVAALPGGRAGRLARNRLRRRFGAVFQDPLASLDPRLPVGDILAEPLTTHGYPAADRPARVRQLLRLVGLAPADTNRHPHEFSGGQRQRIAIARALALEPRLLILDEPVSALDVSVRAGVLNLLNDLKDRLGLAYLFVSHDLAVVRQIADRVAVMHLGRIVETGPADAVFETPRHPYTRALLSAVPAPDPPRERARQRILLAGDPPSPLVLTRSAAPTGCRFRGRCPLYLRLQPAERDVCDGTEPALAPGSTPQHAAACHHTDLWAARFVIDRSPQRA